MRGGGHFYSILIADRAVRRSSTVSRSQRSVDSIFFMATPFRRVFSAWNHDMGSVVSGFRVNIARLAPHLTSRQTFGTLDAYLMSILVARRRKNETCSKMLDSRERMWIVSMYREIL